MSRILVVDDESIIGLILRHAFDAKGHETLVARDGRTGIEMARAEHPDAIVLDLMMPVMDGWTFAKRLRETDEIPIVVLSAANDLARHAKSLGATDVIGKPFDLDQLLPKVARAAETD